MWTGEANGTWHSQHDHAEVSLLTLFFTSLGREVALAAAGARAHLAGAVL